MRFLIYDSGKTILSTNNNDIPIPVSTVDTDDPNDMFLLAEFGLAVAPNSVNNYVDISGTIGIQLGTGQTESIIALVKILITQTNTNNGTEDTIFISKDTVVYNGIIPFNVIITNNNGTLPDGYYAYKLYIVQIDEISTDPSAVVSGPFVFKAISYEENKNNSSGESFILNIDGTGNIIELNMDSVDTCPVQDPPAESNGSEPDIPSNIIMNVKGNYNTIKFTLKEQIGPIV